MLLFFHLGLGCGAHLDHRHTTRQFGEAFLQLLTVKIGVGGFDFSLDLLNAALDVVGLAGAIDDGGILLGHHDLTGFAQLIDSGVFQFQAKLLADNLAAREDGNVFKHALTTFTETWGLDSQAGKGAAQLVDDQGSQCLALYILGNNEEWTAALDDFLQHR